MKMKALILFLMPLLFAGCYTDDFYEVNKDSFYKLYGNGTEQEAVAMEFAADGGVYLSGNQYVRNQDSSAVLIIKAGADGNQLWSKKFFGKGYNTTKAMLVMATGDVLVLASARMQDKTRSIPVLYRLSPNGELLKEIFIEEEDGATATLGTVPEDMVLGDNGMVFVIGNIREKGGVVQKAFIKKIELQSGEVSDQREFSTSGKTEAKNIFRNGDQYVVMGDTWQEKAELINQNIFVATFSENLIEAGLSILGSAGNDTFEKAILNSLNEFVILSTEQSPGLADKRGVVSFIHVKTHAKRVKAQLNISNGAILGPVVPETIGEDKEGAYYVALNATKERVGTNIFISKLDSSGAELWDFPKETGGEGSDRVAQLRIKDGYTWLLKTIDMQNENTLIGLSKIRF